MTVTIATSIIPAGSPEPVQLVIDGIPAGAEFSVVGSLVGGDTWAVPGGMGVGSGSQVALVDNRAALNVPVVYRVLTAGEVYESAPVTVAHDGRHVLQSLDGGTRVDFVWHANGLPREVTMRSVAFDVPGRARPPLRVVRGGDGGGEVVVRTSEAGTAALRAMLRAGSPVVLRTDGSVRDWPAVEILHLMGASSQMWDAIDPVTREMSTDRVWSLSYLLVDDPQPSQAVSAFDWDDFDAAGLTWDELEAMSLTWDEFDTYPWTQL